MNECTPIAAAHDHHNCDKHAKCDNGFGTFNCTCNAGWEGNGTFCANIDECDTGFHQCDTDTTECVDNTGDIFDYTCPCLKGSHKVNQNDKTCHDMNECNPID